jgi:putative membrane-bound dehydrogenase-like protein
MRTEPIGFRRADPAPSSPATIAGVGESEGRSLSDLARAGLLLLAAAIAVPLTVIGQGPGSLPRLADNRLQITLYAEHPDIVTPIGAAVDSLGRLYVVESHTHSPPSDYDGPKGDLIKVFEGTKPDGRAERVRVFADDLFQAQTIAFDPRGVLYVVCTRGLFVLHDRDGDGRSEARTRILTIEPYAKRANPHGQMQGIAFSSDGWVYVGRGAHVGGVYSWVGADGTELPGLYDGGDIVRIRPDGMQLERVASGFWNPFALTLDREGRVIAIDNDPDARGPNRLLHIIGGGDYGYKSLFGRFGLHPYLAWEGDLPGTLPMIDGVGEAPTGVIDASMARLPADYKDSILVSVWGEHNLALYRTTPAGSSIRGKREIFLQGEGHDTEESPFRPSGLTTAPDGTIYISDWMLIDYTTHKRGRIWKVTPREGVATVPPRLAFAPPEPSPALVRLNQIYRLTDPADYVKLREALSDDDPFIRSAAVTMLSRPVFQKAVVQDLEHPNERVRLGALLALRKADVSNPEPLIRPRLRDSSRDVIQMAMIWAGEKVLTSLAPDIDASASAPNLNKPLFETWLATMQILQHAGLRELYAKETSGHAISRDLSPAFIERLSMDERRPAMLRALALRWIADVDASAHYEKLLQLARSGESALQLEALRRLATSKRTESVTTLREVAFAREQPAAVRAEALLSLASSADASLRPLLDDPDPVVRLEAARTLRVAARKPEVRAALKKKLDSVHADAANAQLVSQLAFMLGTESAPRPDTVEGWQKLLATGGDIDAGRRVFFSSNSACNACHVAEGRGGVLGTGFSTMPFGPDLSVIGRTANRQQLIESIVAPSNSVAPEMQGWIVKKKSGEVLTGRQIDQEARHIQLIMIDGKEYNIPRQEIASWGAMDVSLMPVGLPSGMAIEEFRDLLAYLESLK